MSFDFSGESSLVVAIIIENIVRNRIVDFKYDKFRCFTFCEIFGDITPENEWFFRKINIINKNKDYVKFKNLPLADYQKTELAQIQLSFIVLYIQAYERQRKDDESKIVVDAAVNTYIKVIEESTDVISSKTNGCVTTSVSKIDKVKLKRGFEELKHILMKYKICDCGTHLEQFCHLKKIY